VLTDPIADMLTRIRNANTAMHDEVRMPSSKQKVALAKLLEAEGYISGFEVAPSSKGPGDVLTIQMKYSEERDRTISGLRRVSTPGLRVLGGLGVAVLSTSHGLMTDREARRRKVGGEVLCFVW
jgi:small subunit ribosomal protein S8